MSSNSKRPARAAHKKAVEPVGRASAVPPHGTLVIAVTAKDPREQAKQIAGAMLRPSIKAGSTILAWGTKPFDVGITDLVGELAKQGALAAGGDLSRLEQMLAIQAHTLDAVFNEFARLARFNLTEHPTACESFMRLGLKAQSQCRATIETLAAVKNPPAVAFVRQANIANGHQQVNNGSADRARGNQFQANELLEPHERLEHRASQTAGFGDSKVAPLAAIDRTDNAGRKGAIESEQPQARRQVA